MLRTSPSCSSAPTTHSDPPRTKELLPLWRITLLGLFRCRVLWTPASTRIKHSTSIVVSNHQSFLDGVLIALASPRPLLFAVDPAYAHEHPVTSRILRFLARRGLGSVIALDRARPQAIRTLLAALERGQSVMIFPTGTIRAPATIQTELPGVQWLCRKSGVPVIRLRLRGADQSRFFGRCGRKLWPRIFLRF